MSSNSSLGLLWCFCFVVLEAIQAVFFGGVFQHMDAFLVGTCVFGLSTAASLTITTVLGLSGFVRGGIAIAISGAVLAVLSGTLITGMLFYGQRLHVLGVGPMAQFGLRFGFYLVLSLCATVIGFDSKGHVSLSYLMYVVAIGLLIMAFPIYAVQKAVSLVPTLTIATVTALGPLFVFTFQIVEGRVTSSPETLLGLCIYFSGAVIAAIGSARINN
ncbi:hypothetical protein N9850_03260 [Granulosicoccus sp.]|nr:hypothetical protein [Granulosicoccus sp.]MDB4222767.1 hypothetical protein [Granulosicoccus sp.]